MLLLTLPKRATIKNYRLTLLYRCVLVLQALVVLAYFLLAEKWSKEIDLSGHATFTVWSPSMRHPARLENAFHKASIDGPCRDLAKYDYADADGFIYNNFTCRRMCGPGEFEIDCYNVDQVMTVDNTKNSFFFVTHSNEHFFKSNKDPVDVLYNLTRSRPASPTNNSLHSFVNNSFGTLRHIVPLEQAYDLSLTFNFRLLHSTVRSMDNLFLATTFTATSSNSAVDILDWNSRVVKTLQPNPNGIYMTLNELMTYAGRSDWLDDGQAALGRNTYAGARISDGPTGRVTGFEIDIRLSCFGHLFFPRPCTAQVIAKPPQWVGKRFHEEFAEIKRITMQYGVSVRVFASGTAKVFSISMLMAFITEAIVLMALPTKLLGFIVQSCLGHLSKVYRHVLDQKILMHQQIGSIAMQLMAASTSFNSFAAEDGLSMQRTYHRLKESLKDFAELDDSDIKVFSTLAFLVSCGAANHRKVVDLVHQKAAFEKTAQEKRIDLKEFVTAFSATGMTHMEEIATLFARERRVGLLERVFLPYFLRCSVVHRPVSLSEAIQDVHQKLPDEEDDRDVLSILDKADQGDNRNKIMDLDALVSSSQAEGEPPLPTIVDETKKYIEELFAKHAEEQQKQFDAFRLHLLTEQSDLIAKLRAESLDMCNAGPSNHEGEEQQTPVCTSEDINPVLLSLSGVEDSLSHLQATIHSPEEEMLVRLSAVEDSLKHFQTNVQPPGEDTQQLLSRLRVTEDRLTQLLKVFLGNPPPKEASPGDMSWRSDTTGVGTVTSTSTQHHAENSLEPTNMVSRLSLVEATLQKQQALLDTLFTEQTHANMKSAPSYTRKTPDTGGGFARDCCIMFSRPKELEHPQRSSSRQRHNKESSAVVGSVDNDWD